MKILQFLASTAVIISLASCEKELDFRYHDINPLVVIEARVTEEGASVTITTTTPMDEPFNDRHITDANVEITDITSGINYNLMVSSDGIFRNEMKGIPGHEYQVSVITDGAEYHSTTRMQPTTELLDASFAWITMPGDDMAVLNMHFTDNHLTEDYYWVRVYRNGEPYTWSVITDRAEVDGILEESITTTHRDESQENDKQIIRDGDLIKIDVCVIDRRMFDYLTALINGSNGIPQFEGSRCLGYFLASPLASETIVFRR